MAVVYLAYDLRLNRRVAIKAMLPDLAFHDGMEERFKREARTAARLDHPNIVVIHSVRDSGDPLFFVMKYVDGAPLDAVIRTHGALPIPVVQGILLQLCSALQYAHSDGVVHRDVKPANILVDSRGTVQVTDFGIAKASDSAHLTRTGLAIGTPTYMCPEQCMGHAQTAASDQYAVGIVGYELLTGNPPFTGNGVATQWAHIQDVPRPLTELRPDCPPDLASAIMRMIAKDPNERWPALRDAVPSIARGLPPDAENGRPALADLVHRTSSTRPSFAITPQSPVPQRAAAPTLAPRTPAATPAIATLDVVPARASLEAGTSHVFRCRALDARGGELEAVAEWSSSNPEIASVDDNGTVSAHTAGSVTIAAMVDAKAAMATVDVVAMQVTRVDVEPSIVTLAEHATVRLAVRAYSAKGKQVAHPTVAFRTTDTAVATISADGTLSAIKPGRTTVTATVGGVEAKAIATVTAATISALGITPLAPSVAVGKELLLTATAKDASGHAVAGHVVSWRSLAPNVAKVNAKGRVLAKQPGTATIVAEYDGVESRVELTVTAAGARRSPVGMVVGVAAALLIGAGVWAYARRSDTTALPATLATTSAGTVAPTSADSAARRAAVAAAKNRTEPTVMPADSVIATMQLTEASPLSLEVGDVTALGVRAANKQGQQLPRPRLKWEASNIEIGTVDSNGVVTALAVGRTLVTVRGAGRERTIAIDVHPASPARMTLALALDSLEVGDTTAVTAQLFDKQESPVQRAVTWKSSNAAVASVDDAGVIRAAGVGQATITASVAAITDSVVVFVAPVRPTVSDAALDSARMASSSLRAIGGNRAPSRGVAPKAVGALPPGVRAPSDAEVKSIVDSLVTMIERRVVRVTQLTKAQGEPGTRFVKFLDKETPDVRIIGTPAIGETRASGSHVSFSLGMDWKTFTQSKRQRTVNLDAVIEPVKGGWIIRELRFPTGFAP